MRWPQYLVLSSYLIGAWIHLWRHGERYVEEYNFKREALRVVFWVAILKLGDFF